MDVFSLLVTTVLVTISGALAPGPLFFATVSYGARSGLRSGLVFAIAHTLVEFTLVMLLAMGLLAVTNEPVVRFIIGIVGGMVLLVFGALQIRNTLASKPDGTRYGVATKRNLLLIGLAFTGLNPFFVVWWLTVGANLILISLEFASVAGVVFMYFCHVWMDFLWLGTVAHFAKVGTNIAGFKWYKLIMVVFGVILIYFGFSFLINSLR